VIETDDVGTLRILIGAVGTGSEVGSVSMVTVFYDPERIETAD
jgi:hypothetical protein